MPLIEPSTSYFHFRFVSLWRPTYMKHCLNHNLQSLASKTCCIFSLTADTFNMCSNSISLHHKTSSQLTLFGSSLPTVSMFHQFQDAYVCFGCLNNISACTLSPFFKNEFHIYIRFWSWSCIFKSSHILVDFSYCLDHYWHVYHCSFDFQFCYLSLPQSCGPLHILLPSFFIIWSILFFITIIFSVIRM